MARVYKVVGSGLSVIFGQFVQFASVQTDAKKGHKRTHIQDWRIDLQHKVPNRMWAH